MITLENRPLDELVEMEWLETNGLGGYASSSISGANTRRYHGLLVAALTPPTERKVLVAKTEEWLGTGKSLRSLTVNQYPGTMYPNGHTWLSHFERRPLATWYYKSEHWQLEKKCFMVANSNTTVLIYRNTGTSSFTLQCAPLFVHKDYHALSKENHFDYYFEKQGENILKIHAHYGSLPLYVKWSPSSRFVEDRSWYKNVQLRKEKYRGLDFEEDYYRLGHVVDELLPGEEMTLVFSTDVAQLDKNVKQLERAAVRLVTSKQDPEIKDRFYNDLLVSGNQFITKRCSTNAKTIIAGYPWFTDWGRDTMIAMRGLTIANGDQKVSKSILSSFLKYLKDGLIPNRFPDNPDDEVEYNTIDATLWLFIALYEYHSTFQDERFIARNLKKLESILLHHISGTHYGIGLTEQGFIQGGLEGFQLTWMDARVNGEVVTPRMGCPVEINALWFNALCIYEHFCTGCNRKIHEEIHRIKNLFKTNFEKNYLAPEGYLYDVVVPQEKPDKSFRPNQIYAVSLPFSLLDPEKEKKLVELLGEKLYTDYGLRTLSPDDFRFVRSYGGDQWKRDHAYHQGTVWPFLLMEYWEAYLKVNRYGREALDKVALALESLRTHFYKTDCLHGISEIFDGESPKEGRGCIQQAWSVAALLKLYSTHKLYKHGKPMKRSSKPKAKSLELAST